MKGNACNGCVQRVPEGKRSGVGRTTGRGVFVIRGYDTLTRQARPVKASRAQRSGTGHPLGNGHQWQTDKGGLTCP